MDPGNLRTGLQREAAPWFRRIWNLALNPAIYGAHTELFAGLSPAITEEKNGCWSMFLLNGIQSIVMLTHLILVVPYGRFGNLRPDIEEATKATQNGGSGIAKRFWEWSEDKVQAYA